MAQDDGSSMPGWAAFDKDEERPPRRRLSPTTVVVVAGALAAVVVVGGALLPDAAPKRTASAEPAAGSTALPTASGTPAPTLSTAPPAPSDTPAAPDTPDTPAAPSAAPTDGSTPGADGSAPAPSDRAAPAVPPAPPAPAPVPAPAAAQAMGPLNRFATATVPATSRDSVDAGNRPVTYAAAHLLDGHPGTAWRADGDLTGQVLTFTFDRPRELSKAGLVNGYAKVDLVSHADRYDQTRRITRVTWTIDGQEIVQDLSGHDREEQVVRFPPVLAQSVSLRIDAVTTPGGPRFDETAISEVVLTDD